VRRTSGPASRSRSALSAERRSRPALLPELRRAVAAERPPEERKLATVLFADLVGSKGLAGTQDPERSATSHASRAAVLQALQETGATGLEPATSGVTGQMELFMMLSERSL